MKRFLVKTNFRRGGRVLVLMVPAASEPEAVQRVDRAEPYWNPYRGTVDSYLVVEEGDAHESFVDAADQTTIWFLNSSQPFGEDDRCVICRKFESDHSVEVSGGGDLLVVYGLGDPIDPGYLGTWGICQMCAAMIPVQFYR